MDNKRKRKLTSTRLRVRKFRAKRKFENIFGDEPEIDRLDETTDDGSSETEMSDDGHTIDSNGSDDDFMNDNVEEEIRDARYNEHIDQLDIDSSDDNLVDDDEGEERGAENNEQPVYLEMNESESDDDEEDDEPNPPPEVYGVNQRDIEIRQLKQWAVKHRIAHAHLVPLLHILRARLLPGLPACSKTFLNTTGATYEVKKMRDGSGSIGEFTYIGVEKGLIECLNTDAHDTTQVVDLQFNCDGLLLSKSSSHHIWPILCKVHSDLANYEPFVVTLYSGESKPESVEHYLKEFVTEMNKLLQNGVTVAGVTYTIKIKCFICDTPARAFLEYTKGHTSANACERCVAQGMRIANTMTYVSVDDDSRTDNTFRNFDDPDHHHKATPLLLINPEIDMISSFVLDFMHLGFLGGDARIMDHACSKNITRISATSKNEMSRRLRLIKSQIPHEFQRQLRTLGDLSKWKATEHQLFLLYVGPIVVKKNFNTEMYNNFILLHLASRLLWSKETATTHYDYAKLCLIKFFKDAQKVYGAQWATVNMHHLIHLADDVKNMKCSLSEMNAFPYENLLGKIKRFPRSPYRSVAQLCRRLHEQSVIKEPAKLVNEIKILKEKNGIIIRVQYKGCLLCRTSPNNTVLLKNNKIFPIKIFLRRRNTIQLKGVLWKVKDLIYSDPIESTHFNISELHLRPASSLSTIDINKVKTKIMKLTLNYSENGMDRVFAIPLLHE